MIHINVAITQHNIVICGWYTSFLRLDLRPPCAFSRCSEALVYQIHITF
jgi:hypothetical protein